MTVKSECQRKTKANTAHNNDAVIITDQFYAFKSYTQKADTIFSAIIILCFATGVLKYATSHKSIKMPLKNSQPGNIQKVHLRVFRWLWERVDTVVDRVVCSVVHICVESWSTVGLAGEGLDVATPNRKVVLDATVVVV